MTPRIRLIAMAVMAVAQLAIPATIIYRHEAVLRLGRPYKFKVAPVDPYDAFRGRYVALNFANNQVRVSKADEAIRGTAWVRVTEGPDGFAQLTDLLRTPGTEGEWLKVGVHYAYAGIARIALPFDRFYMEESVAPEAERALWAIRRGGRGAREAYASVRIWKGRAVIEQLFVDGVPIAQYLRDK